MQFIKYRSLKPLMEIGKIIRKIYGFEISQFTKYVWTCEDWKSACDFDFLSYLTHFYNLLSGETSLLLKRFRHSITPTRPKMPTWRRKVMVEFAKPVFSEKHPTTEFLWQECPRIEEDLKSQKVQCSIWQNHSTFCPSWQKKIFCSNRKRKTQKCRN